jgi:hypothetical protein
LTLGLLCLLLRARFGRGGRMVFDRCNPLAPVNAAQLESWVQ